MKTLFHSTLLAVGIAVALPLTCTAQSVDLYVDAKTKQIFTEAGPGRVRLGSAVITPDAAPAAPKSAPQKAPASVPPSTVKTSETVSTASTPQTVPVVLEEKKDTKPATPPWYEKLSLRGYTQFRYTDLWDHKGAQWYHPADRSVAPDQTFIIRRGRLILFGDVSENLFMYIQPDMMASPSDGDFSAQLRDMYGDISFDPDKEFRLRVGQSKVPFGHVNMQSSQNRAPMERPDAINSAAEGERDIGTFFYWAPKEIRERFSHLVRSGLKGSGDYGLIGVGAYSGQGLNRSDKNNSLHTIARASYPFKFDNGQFFEAGIQAYTGKFVPKTKAYTIDGSEEETTPSFDSEGVTDQRIGFTTVMYPQPIGFEAEWNIGRTPQLSDDYTTIDDEFMQGGYIQANAKIDSSKGTFFPFVRWQYFDGARKFGSNAPEVLINEWDFGTEWSPWKDVEFSAMYTYTLDRTNSNSFPYDNLTNGSRLAVQIQVNY